MKGKHKVLSPLPVGVQWGDVAHMRKGLRYGSGDIQFRCSLRTHANPPLARYKVLIPCTRYHLLLGRMMTLANRECTI